MSIEYSINVQPINEGFGSYLNGIIPDDIAVSCGAFSQSMRQIKNITNIPVEKFAQVVANLETMKDLDLDGTNKIGRASCRERVLR
jgi:hypothetical protein